MLSFSCLNNQRDLDRDGLSFISVWRFHNIFDHDVRSRVSLVLLRAYEFVKRTRRNTILREDFGKKVDRYGSNLNLSDSGQILDE